MHHSILGCFLLAFTNLSVGELHFHVYQKPRFYGTKTGQMVRLVCSASDTSLNSVKVEWHKMQNEKMNPFSNPRASSVTFGTKGYLTITELTVEDSGLYYCEMNKTMGLGTELQVFRSGKPRAAEWRSKVKDFIIFLQAFLLVLCIVLPLTWYYKLNSQEEAVYEEPVEDHMYEGLEIAHHGDLYEDISAFSQHSEATCVVQSPEQQ